VASWKPALRFLEPSASDLSYDAKKPLTQSRLHAVSRCFHCCLLDSSVRFVNKPAKAGVDPFTAARAAKH